jgi:N-methylhydantoinase B
LSTNILTSQGVEKVLPRQSHIHLEVHPGDRIYHRISGSGGFGEPAKRDPRLVLADVIEGKVSIEQAYNRYRVVIDPEKPQLDEPATARLRGESQ